MGMYDLSIEIPATPEVQLVEFFAEGGLGGNFTMTMAAHVDDRLMSNTTDGIDIPTATESSIETYLENLKIITDGISIKIINQTEFNFRFLVTFTGMNADLPLLELDTLYTYGNNFGTKVSQIQAGTPHRGIVDSPFKLTVAPNVTDAGMSTAFGQGLFYGVTGEVSKFTIQAKDRWGNNRLHNQSQDIFKVHAFIPDRSYDAVSTAVEGTVVYDSYSAGGTYDVEFTPVIQGEYVVNVMLAEQLEVLNLTTHFTNMGDRKGYFTLSYGKCGLTNPCPRTKRLAWDSDANDVKLALEGLPGVGKLDVVYSQTTDMKNSAWAITFLTACDMDEIAIYEQTMPANTIAINTVHEAVCSYISTEQPDVSYPGHFVNTANILHEVQNVTLGCPNISPACEFHLEFRGHRTNKLSWDAPEATVKEEFEKLSTVGTVDVTFKTDGLHFSAYLITFMPTDGYTIGHLENFGNLPPIEVVHADGKAYTNSTVYTIVDGYVPYHASVEAITIDASKSTAIHSRGVPGWNGLKTGIYQDETRFRIESRDSWSNRVFHGPINEIQIIETMASERMNGSFTVDFGGHEVDIPVRSSIQIMKSKLESIPLIGRVDVSTRSVTVDTTLTGDVQNGSDEIQFAGGANIKSHFEVGDWIRVHDEYIHKDGAYGPVFTVVAIDDTNKVINLDGAYPHKTRTGAKIYKHDKHGHQYIIEFDSNLGDLPALKVTKGSLNGTDAAVKVTACDLGHYQVVTSFCRGDGCSLNGTFFLEMKGERTPDLAYNVDEVTMQQAILTNFSTINAVNISRSSSNETGAYIWTINFESFDEAPGPVYAEGLLLYGNKAGVTVEVEHCPTTDSSGTRVTSAGGKVGETFLATLSNAEVNIKASVVYDKRGIYDAVYTTPREGDYTLDISKAKRGGLLGQYYNNRHMYCEPTMSQVDPVLDFRWDVDDVITYTGKDYISVKWTGYILPSFSEVYEIFLLVNDGARIWIDDVMIMDHYENEVTDVQGEMEFSALTPFPLLANQLVSVKIEYRENAGIGAFSLSWKSATQPKEVIPSYRLFPSVESIANSPLTIKPSGRKPTVVQDVTVEIEAWNEVRINFTAPADDGGSPIEEYKVEWYSAVAGDYGNLEVQTIKISDNVKDGSFKLSHQGVEYPH